MVLVETNVGILVGAKGIMVGCVVGLDGTVVGRKVGVLETDTQPSFFNSFRNMRPLYFEESVPFA